MKLNYTVLWIDDQPENSRDHIEGIGHLLQDLGFNMITVEKKGFTEVELEALAKELAVYNKYDLILFDYNLGERKKDGAEIAASLRQTIYTDMVFYSGGSSPKELLKKLSDEFVPGVFVVSRTNLGEDIEPIICDQVKRFCDLNSMRGVVLDEMSVIDRLLRDLLAKKFLQASTATQKKQVKSLAGKFKERLVKVEETVETLDVDTFVTTVKAPRITEFEWVRQRLQSLKSFEDLDTADVGCFEKMHAFRNELAHQEAIIHEESGKATLASSMVYPDGLDHDDFKQIRFGLVQIRKEIERLLN